MVQQVSLLWERGPRPEGQKTWILCDVTANRPCDNGGGGGGEVQQLRPLGCFPRAGKGSPGQSSRGFTLGHLSRGGVVVDWDAEKEQLDSLQSQQLEGPLHPCGWAPLTPAC